MGFDVRDYTSRSTRLAWDDLGLDAFVTAPLDRDTLRCLGYMHDVEYHTICYLRDLLVTPAHLDPEVTQFLSTWVSEEYWHGEALAAVLAVHDVAQGSERVSSVRQSLGIRDRIRPPLAMLSGWIGGDDYVALLMAWGAANEWLTQAGYSLVSRKAGHPTLSALLSRIMRQEGFHIDFYSTQARQRLDASSRARTLTRFALNKFWRPVGSGLMPREETRFLASFILSDDAGREVIDRIDTRIARLPGLDGLHVLRDAYDRLLKRPAPII